MKTVQEILQQSAVGHAVFFLQLLAPADDLKQRLLQWFSDHSLTLESVVSDAGEFYHVNLTGQDDNRLLQWMRHWENQDGSSIDPSSYKLIMIEVAAD